MSLELTPNNELTFKGPFNVVSMTTLKLANPGDTRLAYKIKTTAPKRYCVKPNSGFLDADTTVSIQGRNLMKNFIYIFVQISYVTTTNNWSI